MPALIFEEYTMTRTKCLSAFAASAFAVLSAPVQADAVTEWNALAIGCANRAGPTVLLDLALVNAAMHDAIQAIEKRYQPYLATPPANGTESRAAAAAAAARRVLATICPATAQGILDTAFAPYVAGNDPGLAVGDAAGVTLLTKLRGTTTTIPLPFTGGTGPGDWRPTPPPGAPTTPGAPMAFVYLATTEPFVMTSPSQFRPGPAPALTSQKYRREYDEVKAVGAVGSHPAVGACPAPRETDMARFWSGNFVAQWNQVARDIALDRQLPIGETARLLALANLAAADAAIAVWDSKHHFNYWRPLTAIRLGDTDGNDGTVADPSWTPFIESSHFPTGSQTPAYPDYVSGANGLTGAFTTALQLFFGTDWVPFEIYKAGPATVAICTNPRVYRRLSDAAQEVVDARIYLGIHFRSADAEARRLGARVASWTFAKALRPVKQNHHDDDRKHDYKHD
jgi:hypothetical protein